MLYVNRELLKCRLRKIVYVEAERASQLLYYCIIIVLYENILV